MARKAKARLLGRHIVAGVSDVLEQVSSEMAWESIAEAVRLASQAFQDHAGQYIVGELALQPLRS